MCSETVSPKPEHVLTSQTHFPKSEADKTNTNLRIIPFHRIPTAGYAGAAAGAFRERKTRREYVLTPPRHTHKDDTHNAINRYMQHSYIYPAILRPRPARSLEKGKE